ncbi:MAG: glycosyltransferase family 4 protein [Pseudodesulfovibrio sp.]
MRITLCISSLGQGGAERIACIMANHWLRRGDAVSIVTLADAKAVPAYPLDSGVAVRNLGLAGKTVGAGKLLVNLRRLMALRRELRRSRPDVVIGFMDTTSVLALLAAAGAGVPVIAFEHCHPVQFPLGRGWRSLRRLLYPRAAAVVVLGEEIRRWFEANVGPRRLLVIQNPVPVAGTCGGNPTRSGRVVLGVGRLAEEKRFHLLLEAFARVADSHPEWRLEICGEGPERADIERRIGELGLEDRVVLHGWVADVTGPMLDADIFALSSRSEAFPAALCEAMACGLPAVSFDCPSGPAEIIRHGVDGLLAPTGDVAALADGLDRLMGDPGRREAMGRAAAEGIRRFSPEIIMARWDDLFREVVK